MFKCRHYKNENTVMVRETWVQSMVASYQRLLKWYFIPPCLTLINIRFVSRVKWCNPGKGVSPSPTPWCRSYWKGSFRIALDYGRQLYFLWFQVICNTNISSSSCCKHRFLWLSLTISLWRPLLPTGPLDYILCPYRAILDKFFLIVQHLHVRMKGYIRVRPYISSSVPYVLSVLFGWFLRLEVGGRTAAALWDLAYRICSVWLVAFLCTSHIAFSLYAYLASIWFQVTTTI